MFRSLFQFRQKEVDAIFKTASKHGSCYGIKILYTNHDLTRPGCETSGRVLLIASRKVGKAVVRNKIRRQIKSVIYEHQLVPEKGAFVILLYPQAVTIPFDKLKAFLVKVLAK